VARSAAQAAVDRHADNAERLPLPESMTGWHGFLISQAANWVHRRAEELLEPDWFSLKHFGVLTVIRHEPGLNQRRLGVKVRIDRTTIVAIVDDLEKAGLIERRSGLDRRSYELYITQAGMRRLRQLQPVVAGLHEELLAPLSPEQRETFSELLKLITR
jgi:MarR family transcriptional regulator, lower aerobic nicotinate degradation pathway regulator